jgi:ATP-binding cassette, subfamily F, member 3
MTLTELRTLLGCFLFGEDDVFKPIGVLSGGERNRYALARLLVSPSNFLLLDEPTNHLDMRAKDVLLEALRNYTGTLVFVSHDRYFIDKLATRIFEIGGGAVHVHSGNYEDYLRRKENEKTGMAVGSVSPVAEALDEPGEVVPPETADARPKRLNPIKLRQLEDRAAEIEEEVAKVETEIAELEGALANYVNAELTIRQTELLNERRAHLDALVAEWELTTEALEDAH